VEELDAEEQSLEVPSPPAPGEPLVTVVAPRPLERSTVVGWETHMAGLDLGEKELDLLAAIRAYLGA
jgi:hypothetical protein